MSSVLSAPPSKDTEDLLENQHGFPRQAAHLMIMLKLEDSIFEIVSSINTCK